MGRAAEIAHFASGCAGAAAAFNTRRFPRLGAVLSTMFLAAAPPTVAVVVPSARLERAYVVMSTNASDGWWEILRIFERSWAFSTERALEVQVLYFNVSSPARIASVFGDRPLDIFNSSLDYEPTRQLAATMSRDRWITWHVAMLHKSERWAQLAKAAFLQGRAILCVDSDHVFFPGWLREVERCLTMHEICFESSFITVGSADEAWLPAIDPRHLDADEFWRHAFVNVGLFAMRCGPSVHTFWRRVVRIMRATLRDRGSANDQNAAGFLLRTGFAGVDWGVLSPYAANQLAPASWRSQRRPGPRVRRMMEEMVIYHAANVHCGTACKLQLMEEMNRTWFARRARVEACTDGGAGGAAPELAALLQGS